MARRVTYPARDGFRETFLVNFTRKGDASGLRCLASLISELHSNASPGWWPRHKEGHLPALLGACVKDMRHLEALLIFANQGRDFLSKENGALMSFAQRCGAELGKIADSIEYAMAHPEEHLKREQPPVAGPSLGRHSGAAVWGALKLPWLSSRHSARPGIGVGMWRRSI